MCDARDLTEQIIALVVRLLTVAIVPGSWRTRKQSTRRRTRRSGSLPAASKRGDEGRRACDRRVLWPQGPRRCSGLDVVRYDAERLHGEFGAQFQLVKHVEEQHHTPFGTTQEFVYCYCRMGG
jgi:hypothetical protein